MQFILRRYDSKWLFCCRQRAAVALVREDNLRAFKFGIEFSQGEHYLVTVTRGHDDPEFFNTGLYNLPGQFSFPKDNLGLYDFTHRPKDVGKFGAPSLRNVAVRAPYMHDGSIATLNGVLDHYAAGGRTIAAGPFAGVCRKNPNRGDFVEGFTLAPQQRQDLLAFLASLTDTEFLRNPEFADPWK